jgi:hypothetical protein
MLFCGERKPAETHLVTHKTMLTEEFAQLKAPLVFGLS